MGQVDYLQELYRDTRSTKQTSYDYCFCVVERSFTNGNCDLRHLNFNTKVYIQTVAATE